MLAINVNDNARHQATRVVLAFFASKLAPTRYTPVGAGLPAKDVNDNARHQTTRVVLASFASKLRSYRRAIPVQFEKVAQCNGKKPTC
ncbi:hypothetical protein ELQ88_05535 [Pseudomonas sp. MPC6]|nr:hypothetical protein ELQ88_05535 [Pseudomonas sp. MPC6]